MQKNELFRRTQTRKQSDDKLPNNQNFKNSPVKDKSKQTHIFDEDVIRMEKYEKLKENFGNNDYLRKKSEGSASKNFDNQIKNVDHAFINTINENFTNKSILFRTPEEIQRKISTSLLEDFDYQLLEKEVLEEEEKLKNLTDDPENLKSKEDSNGIKRGICSICRLECKGYNPNIVMNFENSNKYPGLCTFCGCGAYNHIPSEEKLSYFPKEILHLAVNSLVIESHINFNSILILFEISGDNNNANTGMENNYNNANNTNSPKDKNFDKNKIFNLIRLIKDAGFIVNNNKVIKMEENSDLNLLKSNINSFYKNHRRTYSSGSYYSSERGQNMSVNSNTYDANSQSNKDNKFTWNKYDLVNIFLKDNNEANNFIEKSRDNKFEKTLKNIDKLRQNPSIIMNEHYNSIRSASNFNIMNNILNINNNCTINNNNDPYFTNNSPQSNNNRRTLNNNNENPLIQSKRNTKETEISPRKLSMDLFSEYMRNNNMVSFTANELEKNLNKHNNQIRSSIDFDFNYLDKFKNNILAFSISLNSQENIVDFFERFVLSCKVMFPENMKLMYYSKNKINALWDIQVMFPDLFKVNSFISYVSEKPDFFEDELDDDKELSEILSMSNRFFAIKSKNEKLKENSFLLNTSQKSSYKNDSFILKDVKPNLTDVLISKKNSVENRGVTPTNNNNPYENFTNNFASNILKGNSNSFKIPNIPNNQDLIDKILSKKEQRDKEKKNSLKQKELRDRENYFIKYNSNDFNNNNDNKPSFLAQINQSSHNGIVSNKSKAYKRSLSKFLDYQYSKGIIINKDIPHFEKVLDLIHKFNDYQDFSFIKNLSNFITKGNNYDNLNCSILFNSTIGNSSIVNNLLDSEVDVFNIHKKSDVELLSNIFFKDVNKYEHVTIILRPYIVRSGIADILLNIFKLNNFIILKRKLHLLTVDEIKMIFKYEKIDENFQDEYIKMMTDSNSELVLLSKFSAINDAKILCNNNSSNNEDNSTNNSSLIDLLDLNYEKKSNNDILNFNKNFNKNQNKLAMKKSEKFKSFPTQNNEINLFRSFNNLINYDYIITKVIDKVISKYNDKVNSSFRYNNLIELRKKFLCFSHSFNICMFIPQEIENKKYEIDFDYVNTFELEKVFFEEFNDIQESLIIIKPEKGRKFDMNDFVKICLNRMNFDIQETDIYKLNELEINNLFERYFHHVSPYEYSTNKELFLNNECEVIRLIKSGCNLELQNILGKENDYFFNKKIDHNLLDDKLKILKNNCYLLYNSQDFEYFYEKLCRKISKIEGNYLINFPEYIKEILDSCVKTTIADVIRNDKNESDTLINRYLKFFHLGENVDFNQGLNNIIKQYMVSKNQNQFKDFPKNFENFYTLLSLYNEVFTSAVVFFLETEMNGFVEIRIPYLNSYVINHQNLPKGLMVDLDIPKIQAAKYYHYTDRNFYNQLEEKFNNNDIVIDLEEFDYLFSKESEINYIFGSNSISSRLHKRTMYEINKIFYKFCNDNYLNITPQTYHYRIKPDEVEMDINRIFEVEDFQGPLFLDVISQDYLGYSNEENLKDYQFKNVKSYLNPNINANLNNTNNFNNNYENASMKSMNTDLFKTSNFNFEKYSDKKLPLAEYYENVIKNISQENNKFEGENNNNIKEKNEQYSLSSFLWGRKLAKICKKFEQLTINKQKDLIEKEEREIKIQQMRINNHMNLNLEDDKQKEKIEKEKDKILNYNINFGEFSYKDDKISQCGPLFFCMKESKIRGICVERYLCEYDQYLYVNILHDLKNFQESNLFETEIFNEKEYNIVENKLLEIIGSNAFIESRLPENLVLVPSRIKDHNIRINRKIPQKKKKTKQENFEEKKKRKESEIRSSLRISKIHNYFKDAIGEKLLNQTSSRYVCFSDMNCMKSTVYRYYGAFLYMLKIYFKKIDRKTYLLGNLKNMDIELEYDKMLDAVILGLNNFIEMDLKNDEKGYNAYKNEYYLYMISEIKYQMNEMRNLQRTLKLIEEKFSSKDYEEFQYKINEENFIRKQRNSKMTFKDSENNLEDYLSDYMKNYEEISTKIKKEISDINMNIEIIFHELKNYEIKHRIMKTDNDNKLISIKKEQYHIPMYTEDKWEQDLTNEKYISKKVINNAFVMNKHILENLKNKPSITSQNNLGKNSFISNMAKSNFIANKTQYVHSTNLLRIPEKEISKEILIEKEKKNDDLKHPIKKMAMNLRNETED